MSAVMQSDTKSKAYRHAAESDAPIVFGDIYQDQTNIAMWRRDLPLKLQHYIAGFLHSGRTLQASMTVAPQNVHAGISKLLGKIMH